MESVPVARRRGRSETSRRAILDAVDALIREVGIDAVTIEGVAARAGVGKQTIYRGWGGRTPLLADALIDSWAVPDAPARGDAVEDLVAWGLAVVHSVDGPTGRAVLRLMGIATVEHPEIAARIDERFLRPLRHRLAELLEAVPVPADAGRLDALMGGLFFRMGRGVPSAEDDVRAIVVAVLR